MIEIEGRLIRFSKYDYWGLIDAYESVLITGSPGSGKTSSSAFAIATSLLRADAGFLVLAAKTSEPARWVHYGQITGRSQSIIRIAPGGPWKFNFLDWEIHRGGPGAGLAENIVELLMQVQDIVAGKRERSGTETFFRLAAQELVRNTVIILTLSMGRFWLGDLYNFVMSAPVDDQAEDAVWQLQSFCWDCIQKAQAAAQTDQERLNLSMARRYWLENFPKLADRTRSSIVATLTSIVDVMLHDFLYDLFCTETTITPSSTFMDGAVIVLDFPVREYGSVGIIAQRLWKLLFEREILRRDVNKYPRPVVLFVDEAANFIGSEDRLWLSEARESKAATIFVSQNTSNLYSALGSQSHDEVNAMLANFQTKIFHCNSDETNEWASQTIGMRESMRQSWGAASNEFGGGVNIGRSEERDYKVEPAVFTTLLKGGPASNWQSEAIVFQAGRKWRATGEPWIRVLFMQDHRVSGPTASDPPIEPDAEATTPEERFWFFLALLEWVLIFFTQRHRIGTLIGAEQVQTAVWTELHKNTSAAFSAELVADEAAKTTVPPLPPSTVNNSPGMPLSPSQPGASITHNTSIVAPSNRRS